MLEILKKISFLRVIMLSKNDGFYKLVKLKKFLFAPFYGHTLYIIYKKNKHILNII